MKRKPIQRGFIFRVAFCLLALALLYAPLVAAAYSAHKMACCASDHCPIPSHHHKKSALPAPASSECGHESSKLASCSLSCCENPDKPFVNALLFLLPVPMAAALTQIIEPAVSPVAARQIPPTNEPLSPPPRVVPSV